MTVLVGQDGYPGGPGPRGFQGPPGRGSDGTNLLSLHCFINV